MSQAIEITNEDIQYAENILLPQGKTFDDERRDFIRNFSTIDLQAVPGSGKTTALLAKLLILETKLPLENGSGILVLSHTNAAVDEIKERIYQYCPKLFSYPNFIGTIQSFVNEFLAKPYYVLETKKKPVRIDNEIYYEQIDFLLSRNTKYALSKSQINYCEILCNSVLNEEMKFNDFWTSTEVKISNFGSHTNTYKELASIKEKLHKQGILSFNDCYSLAKKYLNNFPSNINIINKRFGFIFIDEMQDMDTHQYDLIENLFSKQPNTVIQRIGDKNQSIYNSVKADSIWQDRELVLHLSNSQRLSKPIANIVKNFALHPQHCVNIEGQNSCQLKPHILTYTDQTIHLVIPYFGTIVENYLEQEKIIPNKNKPLIIKAISWNIDWKDDDNSRKNTNKIRLEDYVPNFNISTTKQKEDYGCLKSYLHFYDRNSKSLSSIRKNILNALLKILRFEKILTHENSYYTIAKIFTALKETSTLNYEEFKLHIYQFSIEIIKENYDKSLKDLKDYIPVFIKYFSEKEALSSKSKGFIDADTTGIDTQTQKSNLKSNILERKEFNIEITSVHSVKGQTHDATLYLESCFHEHESKHLTKQFLGQNIGKKDGVRVKQATKMAYVGFSRATQLLCVAIHKDRFEQHLNTIDPNIWEIKDVS